ncbi:hypothetical protein [Candidatus Frankia alpina]|uniref:hypothetical protein n=1 Tax=Candidatus Frankia alpina TaxID=2699483 RepID=UPI001F25F034|nr:hypothetical protein [Candidatus Frankia alpina]
MNLPAMHRSGSAVVSRPEAGNRAVAADPRAPHRAIEPGSRSCCCPSEPVAQVVLAPIGSRAHEIDLLLCAHHLRRSAPTLTSSKVAIYDRVGKLIEAPAKVFGRDR